MTPQRAKELLPIIQAFAEGKKIEWWSKDTEEWAEPYHPFSFEVDDIEWRIKPEPREYWIIYHENGSIYARDKCPSKNDNAVEIVHVKEVL